MPEGKLRVELTLQWQPVTPFHVGSGQGRAGIVHRGVVRSPGGQPFVPGSALKGRVRHYAMAIYRARKGGVCTWQQPRAEWEEAGMPGPAGCGCELCALFGAPGFAPGALTFTDLTASGPPPAPLLRSTTALDPVRRVARDGRLFTVESVGGGITLTGCVCGWLAAGQVAGSIGLLYAALRLVPHLGGGRSRGLGWGQLQVQPGGDLRDLGAGLEGWVAAWI